MNSASNEHLCACPNVVKASIIYPVRGQKRGKAIGGRHGRPAGESFLGRPHLEINLNVVMGMKLYSYKGDGKLLFFAHAF